MRNILTLIFVVVTLSGVSQGPNDAKSSWQQFITAYTKKDNGALTRIMELPIRENVFNSKYGNNPSLNLTKFLSETISLKKYNLGKSTPVLNQKLKEYASFEGYIFNPDDIIYEVILKRYTSNTIGYEMALYIKENNGVFKIFAFDPETSFNLAGD